MKTTTIIAFLAKVIAYTVETVKADINKGQEYLALVLANANVSPRTATEEHTFKNNIFSLSEKQIGSFKEDIAGGVEFFLPTIKCGETVVEDLPEFCHLHQQVFVRKDGTKTVIGEKVTNPDGSIAWTTRMKVRFICDETLGVMQDPLDIADEIINDPKSCYKRPTTATPTTEVTE